MEVRDPEPGCRQEISDPPGDQVTSTAVRDPEPGYLQEISDPLGGQVIDRPLLRYGIHDLPIMKGIDHILVRDPGPGDQQMERYKQIYLRSYTDTVYILPAWIRGPGQVTDLPDPGPADHGRCRLHQAWTPWSGS
jgi:hypothetical protein